MFSFPQQGILKTDEEVSVKASDQFWKYIASNCDPIKIFQFSVNVVEINFYLEHAHTGTKLLRCHSYSQSC